MTCLPQFLPVDFPGNYFTRSHSESCVRLTFESFDRQNRITTSRTRVEASLPIVTNQFGGSRYEESLSVVAEPEREKAFASSRLLVERVLL
jgi:hypothetical protein